MHPAPDIAPITPIHLLRVRHRGAVDDVREVEARLVAPGLSDEALRDAARAVAARDPFDRLESFALTLARHLLDTHTALEGVIVDLTEHEWARVMTPGPAGREPHPRAFRDAGEERVTARVEATRGRVEVESGLAGLRLLRTADAPGGCARLLVAGARWRWSEPPRDWAVEGSRAREALLQAFAERAREGVELAALADALARAVLDGVTRAARASVTLLPFVCGPVDAGVAAPGPAGTVYEPAVAAGAPVEATVTR
jgi:hypothetical protein